MSIQKQFEQFYENIKLTPLQKEDAKKKYDGVCKKLHDCYYPDSEYNGQTKLLIGSYGKRTNIRPPRDVDVIFIMPEDKFEQYDDNQSNSQSQLLQDIKKVLSKKYSTTDKIKGRGKVVLIEFADGTHNIELLPAWEQAGGKFKIPNTEDGGSWEIWDSREEIKRITESDLGTNGTTRALIRMIKKWSENCTARLQSYQIENKVLDFFAIDKFSNKEYPILARDFFDYFFKTTTERDLQSHLNTALSRATNACEFEEEDKPDKAVEEWQKIFGDDFPKSNDEIDELQKKYPSDKEEFLERDYGISTKLNPQHVLKIDAVVTLNGFRDNWLSKFITKNFFFLKKEKKLVFKIIENTVPPPYQIKWKVRNFGEEAKKDLRGEIVDDFGHENKEEHTKYLGKHYVECYIIKDNVCVAKDRIWVPIGSDY
jgi:hypothetical protein